MEKGGEEESFGLLKQQEKENEDGKASTMGVSSNIMKGN